MLIFLLIAIFLTLLLLYANGSGSRMNVTEEQRAFCRRMGYEITNPSIVTYGQLGKMGRLGNQLFEIAATLAVAKVNRCRVVFSESIAQLPVYRMFDLDLPLVPSLSWDVNVWEQSNFDPVIIPPDGRVYNINGYRQSMKYLEPIQYKLRDVFSLREKRRKGNYIAIHIRRTDCVKPNPVRRFFDEGLNCSLQYYREAIARLRKEHHLSEDTPVLVATDDREWVGERLSEIDRTAELSPEGSSEDDFVCLCSASYLVVSNSTFSLWAALLSDVKPDCIVAPSLWWHPNNKVARLLTLGEQHTCPEDWLFNDPITGERVEYAYHWSDYQPSWWERKLRSVCTANLLRYWN